LRDVLTQGPDERHLQEFGQHQLWLMPESLSFDTVSLIGFAKDAAGAGTSKNACDIVRPGYLPKMNSTVRCLFWASQGDFPALQPRRQ